MFELIFICPELHVETISDALTEQGALGVSVEDAQADTGSETPLFGEPGMPAPKQAWLRSRVQALFDTQAEAHNAALWLKQEYTGVIEALIPPRKIAEQDWVRLTQAQFEPVCISPGFWIVPSWHEAPAQAQHVIQLDPGMAFGTGTHPTTKMCLRWLAANSPTDKRVLDYGCGSGILAIAAAKLGADSVDAVDIDEAALDVAKDNAARNQVTLNLGLPELAQGQYDTVLANILAQPLKVLAPLLCAHLPPKLPAVASATTSALPTRPTAALVLAGVLERQVQELQEAYAPYCDLQVKDLEEGWVLLVATH